VTLEELREKEGKGGTKSSTTIPRKHHGRKVRVHLPALSETIQRKEKGGGGVIR